MAQALRGGKHWHRVGEAVDTQLQPLLGEQRYEHGRGGVVRGDEVQVRHDEHHLGRRAEDADASLRLQIQLGRLASLLHGRCVDAQQGSPLAVGDADERLPRSKAEGERVIADSERGSLVLVAVLDVRVHVAQAVGAVIAARSQNQLLVVGVGDLANEEMRRVHVERLAALANLELGDSGRLLRARNGAGEGHVHVVRGSAVNQHMLDVIGDGEHESQAVVVVRPDGLLRDGGEQRALTNLARGDTVAWQDVPWLYPPLGGRRWPTDARWRGFPPFPCTPPRQSRHFHVYSRLLYGCPYLGEELDKVLEAAWKQGAEALEGGGEQAG